MDLYARVFMGVEMSRERALALPGLGKYAENVGVDEEELCSYWSGQAEPDWTWEDDDESIEKRARVLGMHDAATYVDLCFGNSDVQVLGVCLADHSVFGEQHLPDAVCFSIEELIEARGRVWNALSLLGASNDTLQSIRLYTPVTCSPT